MSMRADLHGKVVLTTGGGVSKATGERFPESGAGVFLADISGTLLDQTIQDLKPSGRLSTVRRPTCPRWQTASAW